MFVESHFSDGRVIVDVELNLSTTFTNINEQQTHFVALTIQAQQHHAAGGADHKVARNQVLRFVAEVFHRSVPCFKVQPAAFSFCDRSITVAAIMEALSGQCHGFQATL